MALLLGSEAASAQVAMSDPVSRVGAGLQRLPAYKGRVELFTLTPRGDVDGMILTDGVEVETPPHLSGEMSSTVKPGDAVTIHGLKAASMPLIQALSVTNDATGRSVLDTGMLVAHGPPPPAPDDSEARTGTPCRIEGRIRMTLHEVQGEVDGFLLADGTIVRIAPPEARRLTTIIEAGGSVVVEGVMHVFAAGTVIDAASIGASADHMVPIEPGRHGKDRRG